MAGKKEREKSELTPNRRIRRSRVSSSRTDLVPCRCTWETCSGDGRTRTPPRHRAIRPSTHPIDWCSSSATWRKYTSIIIPVHVIYGILISMQFVFSAIYLLDYWTRQVEGWNETGIENFHFHFVFHDFANFSSPYIYIYINILILIYAIHYFPLFDNLYSFKLSFRLNLFRTQSDKAFTRIFVRGIYTPSRQTSTVK